MVCCRSSKQRSISVGALRVPTLCLKDWPPNMHYRTCLLDGPRNQTEETWSVDLGIGVVALSLEPSKHSVASADPSLHGQAHHEDWSREKDSEIGI